MFESTALGDLENVHMLPGLQFLFLTKICLIKLEIVCKTWYLVFTVTINEHLLFVNFVCDKNGY